MMAMPDCCMASFAEWGFKTNFALARPGDEHECPICHRVYRLLVRMPGERAVWTEVKES